MSSLLEAPSSLALSWETYRSRAESLLSQELSAATVGIWLKDWSDLAEEIGEVESVVWVAKTLDTSDEQAISNFELLINDLYPEWKKAQQGLKEQLLASGLEPEGMAIPLRNLRSEAELYREENVALEQKEMKLSTQYADIIGAQTVQWDGEEITLTQLVQAHREQDRDRREKAWRLGMERRLADREALNVLWTDLLDVRLPQAQNAGFGDDFRAMMWQARQRFDYTIEDSLAFLDAIEKVIVPAVQKVHDRRKKDMGLDTLRPWDLEVDPQNRAPLAPFETAKEMDDHASNIFKKVNPVLSSHYKTMRSEGLLDLANRKNKAPGGYCTSFPKRRLPFIFMNAVGSHRDVVTLMHECGHAFHVFESAVQPLNHQQGVPTEFAEVASMSMELIAGKYLGKDNGGYYDPEDERRAKVEHLEKILLFFPYMAVVDGFQQWVYTHPAEARDAKNCDKAWSDLWDRFMPGEDWSGLEEEKATGWHRKLHIFEIPFYYVEYGIAQLGALQVWRNSLVDEQKAIADYRHALSLGGTATLPDLFAAAGAKFALDAAALTQAVTTIETQLEAYLS